MGGVSSVTTISPEDGSFLMDMFFGKVRLNANLPDPWIVAEMTALGRDIKDGIVDAADGDLNDVVIRIARGGRVTGKVTDRNGRVTPAFVLAFPEDARVSNVTQYLRLTFVDQNGEFELSQLAPGTFRVVALSGTPGELSPDNLKSLRVKGAPISIRLGATASVQLTIDR